MAVPGFWDNQESARETVGQLKALHAVVKPLEACESGIEDLVAMIEMGDEDESFAAEIPGEMSRLETAVDELEIKSLLDGAHDNAGAIVTINARDGGTDANDWADMLLRMYSQWAQKKTNLQLRFWTATIMTKLVSIAPR